MTNKPIQINRTCDERHDDSGDDHMMHHAETPLRDDAFDLSDPEKIDKIQAHFASIMHILGMDMQDDSLRDTPKRVAKLFVSELFSGLNPDNAPNVSTFDNKFQYNQMLVEKDIVVYSTCEHHFLPIIGRAHVGYIAKDKVIGLSKINRIVDYYAKRPQVQERLTVQIVNALQAALGTEDVACVMEAKHLCVNSRGIRDIDSATVTAEFTGSFQHDTVRDEFLRYIELKSHFNV